MHFGGKQFTLRRTLPAHSGHFAAILKGEKPASRQQALSGF
jgi:hypothetical protein